MERQNSTLGIIAIGLGSVSLLLALVHFYAGPFAPQPTLEQAVAEKAVAIRQAAIAALKGETPKAERRRRSYDMDQMIQLSIAVLGGLSVILAVIGFARRESHRVAAGAACLGIMALGFQFLAIALGAIIFVILVAAVLASPSMS